MRECELCHREVRGRYKLCKACRKEERRALELSSAEQEMLRQNIQQHRDTDYHGFCSDDV